MMNIKKSLLYSTTIFAGLTLITTSIFWIFFSQEIQSKKLIRRSIENQNITLLQKVIENEIKLNAYNLIFLANHKTLHKWLTSRLPEHQSEVIRLFKDFSSKTSIYDQIRFIDNKGMELVRVNYVNGMPVNIADKDLQNKVHRYYFKETIQLGFSQIFISQFDLNMEHGNIEVPLKPMIRFGMPVHDSNGVKTGIVLLNYLGSRLIDHLDSISPPNVSKSMLVNQDGYWLKAKEPEDEWGFMFPGRRHKNISQTDPRVWENINQQEKGQFVSNKSLYTYSTVRFTGVGMMSSTGADHAFKSFKKGSGENTYYWKVVSLVPADEFKAMSRETVFEFLPFYGSVIAVLLVLSLWFGFIINQRITAQEALDKSEAGLRSLFRSVPAGVGLVKDRYIMEANEQLSRMTGYSMDELVGKKSRILYSTDEDFEYVGKEKYDQIKENGTGSVEIPWRCKDGKNIDVLLSSAPIDIRDFTKGVTFSAFDITDRKKAEKELIVSEERYRIIVESSNDGIITLSKTYLITSMNSAFENLIGQKRDDWLDQPVMNLICSSDKEKASRIFEQTLKGEDAVVETLRVQSDPLDTCRICEFKLTPKFDDQIQDIGIIGFVKDLTESIEAQETVQRVESQLRHSQKMEAIGTLAGGIAHDFNNILSAIFGYAQLAELNIKIPDKSTYHISQIVKGAQRASALVQQILTFSRQAENKKSPMKVSVTVKEALRLLRATIPSSIKINDHTHSRAYVMADPTQIHQIVMNLCTNAYHAMRSTGGELTVSLGEIEISEEESIPEIKKMAGKYVKLGVRDTGSGIDETILERIFDPYFTTKEVGEGTGMGLALVQAIVEDHHGFLDVETELNRGTCFYIHLPIITLQSEENKANNRMDPALLRGNETLLFVDDEEQIRMLYKETLEDFGYQLLSYETGLAALDRFEEDPDSVDLVITDMTMPGISGGKLASKLLEIRNDLPIILCTGYSEMMSEEKALKLGIRKYIEKPVSPLNLAKLIREVLDSKQAG